MGARSWFRALTAAVAAVMTFALVPTPRAAATGASAQPIPASRIAWRTCPPGSAAAQAGGFACTTVLVPLDCQDPAGPQIKLAVVRHAATGPVRRGVIFINREDRPAQSASRTLHRSPRPYRSAAAGSTAVFRGVS